MAASEKKSSKLGPFDFKNARLPATGISDHPPSDTARRRIGLPSDTETVATQDPYDSRARIVARARRDILLEERKRDLISQEAYQEGRNLQRLVERAHRSSSGSNWGIGGGGGDPVAQAGLMVERWVQAGGELSSYVALMQQHRMSNLDIMLLFGCVGHNVSYQAMAAWYQQMRERLRGARFQCSVSNRQVLYIANRTREALELWASKVAPARGPNVGKIRADRG